MLMIQSLQSKTILWARLPLLDIQASDVTSHGALRRRPSARLISA
jgi:hypothetical protein